MRIIAGEARGRRLRAVAGSRVRPTADRVREAVFSMLAARCPEALAGPVLDLYAGTGALGLEALSRGASRGTFVESDAAAAAVIVANAEVCRFADRVRVHRRRVQDFLARPEPDAGGHTLALLDPPYAATAELAAALAALGPPLLVPEAVVVAEHAPGGPPPDRAGRLVLEVRRSWGDSAVSLYRVSDEARAAATADATRS